MIWPSVQEKFLYIFMPIGPLVFQWFDEETDRPISTTNLYNTSRGNTNAFLTHLYHVSYVWTHLSLFLRVTQGQQRIFFTLRETWRANSSGEGPRALFREIGENKTSETFPHSL